MGRVISGEGEWKGEVSGEEEGEVREAHCRRMEVLLTGAVGRSTAEEMGLWE